MSEIDELRARLAALEEAAKPPKPFVREPMQKFDPTANMAMPANALRAMVGAGVPVGDIVADNLFRRNPNALDAPVGAPQERGSGWANEVPLKQKSAHDLERMDAIVERFVGRPNERVK